MTRQVWDLEQMHSNERAAPCHSLCGAYLQAWKLLSLRASHSEADSRVCPKSRQSESVCQRKNLSESVCLRMSLSEHAGLACVCLSSSLQARLPPC